MRAHLRRALRRGRRSRGRGARLRGARAVRATRACASPAPTAWAWSRCARGFCSIRRRACARCRRARSASSSSRAARSSSGCSRRRCAGFGFSYAVSSGNELDLDLADYINFLVEDEETRIIACMVEGVRRPEAFMAAAAKALAARKPLLVLKLGRSARGQRRRGIAHRRARGRRSRVRRGVPQLRRAARADARRSDRGLPRLRPGRLPQGKRIAIAGFSGGAKGLLLDYAHEQGLELATFAPGDRGRA